MLSLSEIKCVEHVTNASIFIKKHIFFHSTHSLIDEFILHCVNCVHQSIFQKVFNNRRIDVLLSGCKIVQVDPHSSGYTTLKTRVRTISLTRAVSRILFGSNTTSAWRLVWQSSSNIPSILLGAFIQPISCVRNDVFVALTVICSTFSIHYLLAVYVLDFKLLTSSYLFNYKYRLQQ